MKPHCYTQLIHELGPVTLLAVAKQQPLEEICQLYNLGQRFFAHNYVQEGVCAIKQLQLADVEWHFIGQIQSNKTALIAQYFDWVQTVDRYKIAERLNTHCVALNKVLQVCISVNIDAEPRKGGVLVSEVYDLAQAIQQLPCLKLRGLMVIPKAQEAYPEQLVTFKKVRSIFDTLKQQGLPLDTLSMGMSNDYKAAIAAGSTMVRVGKLLFGSR